MNPGHGSQIVLAFDPSLSRIFCNHLMRRLPVTSQQRVWTGANQFGILAPRAVPVLEYTVRRLKDHPLPLLTFALFWAALMAAGPLLAQDTPSLAEPPHPDDLSSFWSTPRATAKPSAFLSLPVPVVLHGYFFNHPTENAMFPAKPSQFSSGGVIERMEAAFSCNDTPFIDQVRLPVASLWGGRVKLVGFESDVTTANFVLGLPGAGLLTSLSMTGSGHLAMRTPPSDQLVGLHMTFNLHSTDVEPLDNSGLHGMQFLVRAGRGFFQSATSR
jgi:hypothetical protein